MHPSRPQTRHAVCGPSGGQPRTSRHARPVLVGSTPPLRPNHPTRSGETEEEALARRLRESERVEERVQYVDTVADLERIFDSAGDRLVVIEIESASVCQTGWDEEPELHWKDDQKAALEPCLQLKHTFQRTARDCPDVEFLMVQAEDSHGDALCDRLGVEVLPTVQFWKNGRMVWEHRGVENLNQDLGEGVLYFGDTAGGNEKASTYIQDLESRAAIHEFVTEEEDDKKLVVVDVSLSDATPCVHIFPAVMALAKNFSGLAKFARVLADKNDDLKEFMQEENITQVPTFLFYRGGKMIGRHVGSSRGDLIGQILTMQSAAGIPPPRPAAGTKKRPMRRGRVTKS
jgi:thiol-disulfide isomerase/thioredoxin